MPQEEIRRTSPDVFLKLLEKSRRGKLKIYIGHAAGVGKTYQMLEDAHHLKKQGVDVVVGLVETHGRAETAERIGGPRGHPAARDRLQGPRRSRRWTCRRSWRRKPEVVIVDELAHTNVPGTENAKRYQDVEDLLDAGISVMTAVNIQHFESVQDIVSRVTGVDVQERVPDRILRQADAIVNVDLPSEELRERLRAGKIYPAERIGPALENFFTEENLASLRELAMRQIADRLEAERRGTDKLATATEPVGHEGHGRDVLEPRDDAPAAAPGVGARGQAQHELVRRLRPHAPRQPAADVRARAPAAQRERDARHGARRQGRLALGRRRRARSCCASRASTASRSRSSESPAARGGCACSGGGPIEAFAAARHGHRRLRDRDGDDGASVRRRRAVIPSEARDPAIRPSCLAQSRRAVSQSRVCAPRAAAASDDAGAEGEPAAGCAGVLVGRELLGEGPARPSAGRPRLP